MNESASRSVMVMIVPTHSVTAAEKIKCLLIPKEKQVRKAPLTTVSAER